MHFLSSYVRRARNINTVFVHYMQDSRQLVNYKYYVSESDSVMITDIYMLFYQLMQVANDCKIY